jgi:hypothetical protein
MLIVTLSNGTLVVGHDTACPCLAYRMLNVEEGDKIVAESELVPIKIYMFLAASRSCLSSLFITD